MKFVKGAIFLITLSLFSCATQRPQGNTEAEVLYKEATELVSKKRYIQATERLNTLRSQFPYSFYATHAELLQADVLFAQENYPESAAAYILFRDFHPRHENMGYVIFRISESFYRQLPSTFDRDLSAGVEAMKYYQELLDHYGNTEYAKDAQERISKIREMMINKEVYIADFYFKTKEYKAALTRYEAVLPSIKSESEIKRIQRRIQEAQKN